MFCLPGAGVEDSAGAGRRFGSSFGFGRRWRRRCRSGSRADGASRARCALGDKHLQRRARGGERIGCIVSSSPPHQHTKAKKRCHEHSPDQWRGQRQRAEALLPAAQRVEVHEFVWTGRPRSSACAASLFSDPGWVSRVAAPFQSRCHRPTRLRPSAHRSGAVRCDDHFRWQLCAPSPARRTASRRQLRGYAPHRSSRSCQRVPLSCMCSMRSTSASSASRSCSIAARRISTSRRKWSRIAIS